MTEPTTATLDVPGARLCYDVRGSGPVLMLVGAPMDASGFAAIAPLLATDRTVVTYDPRGFARSTRDDPDADLTAEIFADDVHRVLAAVTDEPADMLGSSGGAITGLALVTRHPGQVRTLIAHEPPVTELLPDAAQTRAAIEDTYQTFRAEGPFAAMAKFFAMTGIEAPDPTEAADQQPDPAEMEATLGTFLGHMLRTVTRFRPDIDALRASPTRIVVAGGATSKGQLAHRTAAALADTLGTALVEFPGDHGGFAGEPDAFGRLLREILG